jgi:hypothetical protein
VLQQCSAVAPTLHGWRAAGTAAPRFRPPPARHTRHCRPPRARSYCSSPGASVRGRQGGAPAGALSSSSCRRLHAPDTRRLHAPDTRRLRTNARAAGCGRLLWPAALADGGGRRLRTTVADGTAADDGCAPICPRIAGLRSPGGGRREGTAAAAAAASHLCASSSTSFAWVTVADPTARRRQRACSPSHCAPAPRPRRPRSSYSSPVAQAPAPHFVSTSSARSLRDPRAAGRTRRTRCRPPRNS